MSNSLFSSAGCGRQKHSTTATNVATQQELLLLAAASSGIRNLQFGPSRSAPAPRPLCHCRRRTGRDVASTRTMAPSASPIAVRSGKIILRHRRLCHNSIAGTSPRSSSYVVASAHQCRRCRAAAALPAGSSSFVFSLLPLSVALLLSGFLPPSSTMQAFSSSSIMHLVGDLIALLDAVAPSEEKVFVVGYDWGAIVTWHLAMYRPDRVMALVNLSLPFSPRNPQMNAVELGRQLYGDDLYIYRFQVRFFILLLQIGRQFVVC
ncbi:hypothetical protein SASPL_112389 [Salvia splendens]|uniref:AB hydrolase-1 domain-containing protein n=1 Tax=Salvia splendens TaxID=180675 RepID=A0A8X8Y9Y7_SALSN|nr:hypothetical protein SASPL_112389 [Salvia splendens]